MTKNNTFFIKITIANIVITRHSQSNLKITKKGLKKAPLTYDKYI